MTFSFPDHVALLTQFLGLRQAIVGTIESTLLNVRGKEISRNRDRGRFEQALNACFFNATGLPGALSRLQGQLTAAHLADGFEPIQIDRYVNVLDPLELIVRAYQHWENHRWPGYAGRLTFAQTIYAVFMVRQLESLAMRVWDDGNDRAHERLDHVQRMLDALNAAGHQPVLVRDARWLIQTAQAPFTRHIQPYFTVAERIAHSFTDAFRLGIHAPGAKLAGGHLRSQLRYRMWHTNRPMGEPDNLGFTRTSNAMDGALLLRDLVPLLGAYETACAARNTEDRAALADAILQGLSADPDLYLTRLDLLTPYTMVEDLFVERGDGHARYTALGQAHVALLARYGDLIGRLAPSLADDARRFDPAQNLYSPHGISYGFSVDLLSHIAMDTLVSNPSYGLSLEDTFDSRGDVDHKGARARGWERLPRREGEREHFDHSAEFAAESLARTVGALEARAGRTNQPNASGLPSGRLLVVPEAVIPRTSASALPPGDRVPASEYCFTSDAVRAAKGAAVARPRHQILSDRKEGRYLASAEVDGHWLGVSKIVLTVLLSQGMDAVITDVPAPVVDVLLLTAPGLIALP